MNRTIKLLVIIALLVFIGVMVQFSISLYRHPEKNGGLEHTPQKIQLVRTGADGKPYYFSMADTMPTTTYPFSHVALFQGNPIGLHSLVALENPDPDSLSAILGVVDCSGNTNHVLKITPGGIALQTTTTDDTTGGSTYFFTKNGMGMKKGFAGGYGSTYALSNQGGLPGQTLTLNAQADTARWQNVVQSVAQTHLPTYPSVAQATRHGLKSGEAFILTTSLDGAPIKLMAFVP